MTLLSRSGNRQSGEKVYGSDAEIPHDRRFPRRRRRACWRSVLFAIVFVLRQDRLLYFPTRRLARAAGALRPRSGRARGRDGGRRSPARLVDPRRRAGRALLFFHGNAGQRRRPSRAGEDPERAVRSRRLPRGLPGLRPLRGVSLRGGALPRRARRLPHGHRRRFPTRTRSSLFGESLGSRRGDRARRALGMRGSGPRDAFPFAARVARVHYPFVPSFLVRSRFDNAAKIADGRGAEALPVAEKDEVAPPSHGRRLFEARARRRRALRDPGRPPQRHLRRRRRAVLEGVGNVPGRRVPSDSGCHCGRSAAVPGEDALTELASRTPARPAGCTS